MSRAVNGKVTEAEKLYKSGMALVDIAKKLDLPAGTVRRWKSANKWNDERSGSNERSRKNSERSESAIEQLDKSNLTDKQKLFCVYYVKYFNATKAYKQAYGCSYETALTSGPALLGKPRIRDEITRLKQNRLNREMISPEDIFQKFMDIAFADVTDYLSFGQEEVQCMGPFGPLFTKDEKTGKATPVTKVVNSVRFKESAEVDGSILSEVKQGKDGASIKLADRMRALEWIADHMDMATEEQRARIDALKAKAQSANSDEQEDDGFIEALSGKVDEAWQD